ncbi:LOW QUALITY PROTEIN: modular serine protease-like [Lucilia sericata]|uniref:LOW QUALITY PROTEIN: modular serine protease-like n=1 Tax=Lucilia sericata TaxID=13632 RepID=UPI0018A85740|nr:LOW QUALITY PROTEIN: modular serine protease-like [Lucilia sericata]
MFNDFKIQLILISLSFVNCVHSQCSNSDWSCDNGQCISDNKLCDGKVDCGDRSDEIAENCIQFHVICQNSTFRCTYGACIDGKAKCNGVQDCADNSDELICIQKDSDFQGVCFATEIQCVNSKECINSIDLCNGRVDCKDGSDESLELCINFRCVGFTCISLCISLNAKCNGIKECADGSDEAWQLCTTPRKINYETAVTPTPKPKPAPIALPTSVQCIIPNITELQDLIFKLHPQNETIPIGSFVDDCEVIHIECQNKYALRGQTSRLCQNGKWNFDFPSCERHCDGTLLHGLSVRAVCNYITHFEECPKRIPPGTEIRLNCNFGYTRNPKFSQYIKCLPDGIFDKRPQSCVHSCGRIATSSVSLSKHGIPIISISAPWHVSIHEYNSINYNFICSGSIVSPRIIITAAHCFWDESTLTLRNYKEYQIIAGRSTSNFTTEQNDFSQIVQVEKIHIPSGYNGVIGHQKDDIAFLKLETALRYSLTIAPICMPKEIYNITSKYMISNRIGFITTFGLNTQLQRLRMITLSYHECYDKSPLDSPLADDKFCIINKEGAAVCRGDSGAGFVIQNRNPDGNETIYTLLGVISNYPTTKNDCTRDDDKAYVAITNINYMASEFKIKLANAITEDQTLF